MTWTTIADVLAAALILTGALLSLVAAVGLIRFPDLLTRMHAATKPQVLGLILVLCAVGLQVPTWGTISTLVVIALFQLMTAPVSAHMIARAAYRTKHLRTALLLRDELAEVVARRDQDQ